MVEVRSGDEIDLLDSSIRTVAGALGVTILYALSGIIYAIVASPEAAGVYIFVTMTISLFLRPLKGVTRTLQKRGSEVDTEPSAYLGLSLIASTVWFVVLALMFTLFTSSVAQHAPINSELLVPAILLVGVRVYRSSGSALLGAVGYPSYQTWISSIDLATRFTLFFIFADQIETAGDLILIGVVVQLLLVIGIYAFARVRPQVPTVEQVKYAASFAKWSIPDQIVDRLSYTMPVYVLGLVAAPTAVAVYEASDRFADAGATIAFFLASPLLTKVSGDWSAGERSLEYLDTVITGGTGATFLVLAYIIAGNQELASLAFPQAIQSFQFTILLVGGINLFRAFWTLVSFTLEGIDRPAASLSTKLYGLILAVPITAVLGSKFGAIGGAIGYITMNVIVMVVVLWYAYDSFGRVPADLPLATRFVVSGTAALIAAEASLVLVEMLGGSIVLQASASAIFCLVIYIIVLSTISGQARRVFRRTFELYTPFKTEE